jgi:hypothetical protein
MNSENAARMIRTRLKTRFIIRGALTLLVLHATGAYASPRPQPKHFDARGGFFVQADLDAGGDEVEWEDRFENGELVERGDTAAGFGAQLLVGAFYRPWSALPVELYLGGGYKFSELFPSEGDEGKFDRWVGEFKVQYRFTDRWFAGAGVVKHWDIKMMAGSDSEVRFEPATGFVVEGGWNWLGLHVTSMKYESRLGGPKIDASSIGLRFLNRF